jgi:hypothetical protein
MLIILCAVGVWLLYDLYTGGFISAWFASIVVALILLMFLSVPRRVSIIGNAMEIQCVSDITEIQIDEIEYIRLIPRKRLWWIIPIFGVVGFFGYYGKFFDLKRFRIVTLYASEWNNFVDIRTYNGSHTYISCREAEALIETVKQIQQQIAQQEQQASAEESLD